MGTSFIYTRTSGGCVTREIFGFDTFSGFPSLSEIDKENVAGVNHEKGYLSAPDIYEDLLKCINLYDQNRFKSQFPKIHIIKGDFMKTCENYLKYRHVIPALLYLNFDIYGPIKKALEIFLPRMPKGSIIAFDEANDSTWPGETTAIYEVLDVKKKNCQSRIRY